MKVDLIIPTYNRVKFLERILDYYKDFGKDFRIIVADSSSDQNKIINRQTIKKYSQLHILHLDHFPQTLPQHQKFIEMVKFIKSKYCVFCADDDFVIPNGIKECINFLEKNPDYSAAHGTYISFYLSKNIFGNQFFKWRLLFSPLTINSSKSIYRVKAHLTDFVLTLWAVRRTKDVKAAYAEFSKVQFNRYTLPNFGELLPDALIASFGKIKSIDTFYGARQCFSQINSTYLSLTEADNIGKYAGDYQKFRTILKNNLSIDSRDFENDISKDIDAAMEAYSRHSFQEHLQNKIYRSLEDYPQFISKFLKSLHTLYLFSKQKDGIFGSIDQPSSSYYEDFTHIKSCVLKHGEI